MNALKDLPLKRTYKFQVKATKDHLADTGLNAGGG